MRLKDLVKVVPGGQRIKLQIYYTGCIVLEDLLFVDSKAEIDAKYEDYYVCRVLGLTDYLLITVTNSEEWAA